MAPLPLHKFIAATFAGALAYGLYLASLLVCLRWLLLRLDLGKEWSFRQLNEIKWTTLFVTFLIFACNTAYISVVLQETMEGAWNATMNLPAPPSSETAWENIVICATANTIVLAADSVLIYRCWMLYGRRLSIIVFPCFFWLGALLCTILQIYLQVAQIHNPSIGPYKWSSANMSFGPGIVLLPFWISTVLLNAYSTAVLIRRIYSTAKCCQQYLSVKHLHLAIRIIAESGLLNLSITFAHLLVWFGNDEFPVTIIGRLNAPVTGIAFNWFLIRFQQMKAENAPAAESEGKLTTIKFSHSDIAQRQERSHVSDATSTLEPESSLLYLSLDVPPLTHDREGEALPV